MHDTITQIWLIAGWTILHYIWVGAAITSVAWLGRLLLLRRASSNLRYLHAVACYIALALSPIVVLLAVVQYVPRVATSTQPMAMIAPRAENEPVELMVVDDNIERLTGAVDPENVATPFSSASLPAGQQPPRTALSLRSWIDQLARWAPAFWLLGFPIACCWLSAGLIGADQLRRRSQLISEGPIFVACSLLVTATGMRRTPRLGLCEQITRPILIGIIRPMILLPAVAITGWTPEQVEVVLLHELAHIRRWDNLVSLVQRIGEAMLFFQPGIWIVSAWIRLEREQCCDEAVVRHTQDARFYAETLLFVARLKQTAAASGEPLTWRTNAASAMAQSHLVARIRRILHKEQNMKRQIVEMRVSRRWGFSLLVLVGALLAVAGSWDSIVGQEETDRFVDRETPSDLAAVAQVPKTENVSEVGDQRSGYGGLAGLLGGQSADDAPIPSVDPPKERLRYDGKTFATWNEEWETELNPTRRAEAIRAFEAFARNGYGKDAVVAILNVMRRYNTYVIDSSPEGKLKSAAIAALTKIDRKHWDALINGALQSQNKNEVHFALRVVARNTDITKSKLPLMLGLMIKQDQQIATHAIEVAKAIRPTPPELKKTLRQLLLGKQPEVVRSATLGAGKK